jgi:EpsI family protein
VVIMLMFMIGARWTENRPSGKTMLVPAAPVGAGKSMVLLMALLAASLVAFPRVAEWAIAKADMQGPVRLAAPAALADGWQARQQPLADWAPAFQNPSAQATTAYARDGKVVGLYVGYYRNQDHQRKLVSSENALVRNKDPAWDQVRGSRASVVPGDGLPAMRTGELRQLTSLLSSGGDRLVAWQVYWVNGRFTASDAVAKVYSALYRLLGQGDESAVVIFYTTKEQAGGGEAALKSFVGGNLGAIDAWLRQTRAAQ